MQVIYISEKTKMYITGQ